jgi:rubrerythrin
MTKTLKNLMSAFAGESQANRKYLAFAKKADEEGYHQVARLFRAAAAAETVHAHIHFRNAGMVKSTAENLQDAVSGENYEATTMYPEFLAEAKTEGEKKASTGFEWALESEKVHEQLYRQALKSLGKEKEEFDYYICPVCGFTHARTAPEKCPVCGALGSKFERIQ